MINREVVVYTEEEVNRIKEHYLLIIQQEQAKTATFQELSRELTEIVKKKNNEIEKLNFFLEILARTLDVSSKAIEALRKNN